MIRYKYTNKEKTWVHDREIGVVFGKAEHIIMWSEFKRWEAMGNTAEPFQTEQEQVEIRVVKAKCVRDDTINSDIIVDSVDPTAIWQVDPIARDRMKDTINTAEWNEYGDEIRVNWILANDSIRLTSTRDLKKILSAYSLRMSDIFEQYSAWLAGSKSSDFEYIPSEE